VFLTFRESRFDVRVLILLRMLWTAGAQRIAVNEYRWLKKLGYDAQIVFLRASNTKGYEEILKDVEYTVIRKTSGPLTPVFSAITKKFAKDRGSESTVDLDLILKTPEIAKKKEADYLVCHDQWAGLGGYLAKKTLGLPYVVFIHEKLSDYSVPLLGKLATDVEKKVLENAEKVLAVTDKVAKTVEEKHGVRATVNFPGLDELSSTPLSQKENLLLTVAFWDKGRKPEIYLDIAEKIGGHKLIFAGNWRIPELKRDFLIKVGKRGLEDKVLLKEGLSEKELTGLYKKSKFLLRFGFGEYGLGTPVVEALQHTLPVIVNEELGTSSLIKAYKCGYVLPDINPNAVAEIVSSIDEEQYTSMQLGISKLRNVYTWERHARQLIS